MLAVYDNSVHEKISKFCADSRIPADGTPYNRILKIDPAHLIRMSVGIGFRRARLRYAYMLLRGKNLKTGEVTENVREENLATFKESLDIVMNLNNWHAFINLFAAAGYLSDKLVSSTNAVVYSYILYLIGKYDFSVPSVDLQKLSVSGYLCPRLQGFIPPLLKQRLKNSSPI